jgi:hypothetical protein
MYVEGVGIMFLEHMFFYFFPFDISLLSQETFLK